MESKYFNVGVVVFKDGESIKYKELALVTSLSELLQMCDSGIEDISGEEDGVECCLEFYDSDESDEDREAYYVTLSNRVTGIPFEAMDCKSDSYLFKESVRDREDYVFDYFDYKREHSKSDISEESYVALRRGSR